ncbi:MAG: lipopolysaccharide transport periplasmic protein LptA [Oligoflexales bacterium]|nr:lipopolysaccharide transport periplasmic protein LptA [Oligoflexales bacterium]
MINSDFFRFTEKIQTFSKVFFTAYFCLFSWQGLQAQLQDSFDEPPKTAPVSEEAEDKNSKNTTSEGVLKSNVLEEKQGQKQVTPRNKNSTQESGIIKKSPTKSTQTTPETKKEKKQSDPNAKLPVKISSEGASAIRDDGIIELIKNVVITQGDLKLNSNEAKVYFNNETNEVEKILAEGDVRMEKIDPNTKVLVKAQGKKMTYLNDEQKVILEGNARLDRGRDLLRGKKITYDMTTGEVIVDSVEGLLHPVTE